jgi:DNA polymerase-1
VTELLKRLGEPAETLYLVDISSFIFRAFYAIRPLTTKANEPVNAVYGVAAMLAKLKDDAKPENMAVCYDSKEPSFRKEIFPEYKANRSAPPEELIPQFARIEQLVSAMEIHSFRKSGVEADDLIATLTRRWLDESSKHRVVVVTGDKDLMQLVNDRVQVWDTMNNKVYGETEVEEKFAVKPSQIRDYLALQGDSSDNIPGVPGVGPKTAADLLKQYGDLDEILSAADAGKISGKKGETMKSHRKDAELSARLATVDDQVDVRFNREQFRYRFHVNDSLRALLKELEFNTLLARWEGMSGAAPSAKPTATSTATANLSFPAEAFRTINTEKSLQELLKGIEKSKSFGFDLETTSLNPREAKIAGIAICYDREFGCYIPINHTQDLASKPTPQLDAAKVIAALKPYLESENYPKIGQNLKFDFSMMEEHGVHPRGIGADTMIAGYLLEPDTRVNLTALAAKYLNYSMLTYEEVCGKGKDQITFDQVPIETATRYSAEDALIAVRLWEKLKPEIEREELEDVFRKIDLPTVFILSKLERAGVCIDVAWLEKLSKDFQKELQGIEERISAYTKGSINLNSPKQLGQLLFEELKLPAQSKTKTGFSTDASVLEALAPLHEVPKLLLEYREISKLKGTYVDPLPGLRDAKTGKIHASFNQTVAATGRLSSADPNLQNIPVKTERGRKIRRAFIPSKGNVLLSADYSQIELRLLAHMSGDKELIASFKKNEDVHSRTASEIFGIAPAKVDERQRGIAKAINFGLMYGKTPFGLAAELKISRTEAKEIIDKYFERYSGVKHYLDKLVVEAREKGMTFTLSGRRRKLRDITSNNPAMRGIAERMAMNTPLQGTAADLMKLAMIEIDRRLTEGGYASRLIIQVHDEVLLDCPKGELDQVRALVIESMEGAMKLDVPLSVNSSTGDSWMDL